MSLLNDDTRMTSGMSLAPLANLVMIDTLTENAARKARGMSNSNTQSIKQSIFEAQDEFQLVFKSNSRQTILAITNTMVGSVCLVVPQVFLQNGIISCLLVMIALGLIQYKTCQMIILHQRSDEVDIEQMIKRLLGQNWAFAFRLSSGSLLFIVGVVYFLLINTTLYPILKFIFTKNGFDDYSKQTEAFQFDQFSIQYQALIIFIPVSIPFFFKDITTLIKMAEFGVIAIFSYGIFVFYIFFTNVIDGTIINKFEEVKYFTWNISEPAGQFALAFMIHNTVGAIVKTNIVKSNNERDLGVAYLLASLIYGSIGVFGAFGLLGKNPTDPKTILDYFDSGDISVLIIESLFLFHLISAFPIFNFVSRHQILSAFYPDSSHPAWLSHFYSVFLILVCLLAQLANFNPGLVISFDGAVCGFFLIYVIPIGLHMSCYHKQRRDQIGEVQDQSISSVKYKFSCVIHRSRDRTTKTTRIIIYGFFICVGLLNMGIQFKQLFFN